MQAGVTVAEFWDLTPRETFMVVDAYAKKEEQRQKQQLALAWNIAALSRQKRLPSLKSLLATEPAKPLRGKERARRQKEFEESASRVDVNALAKRIKKRVVR